MRNSFQLHLLLACLTNAADHLKICIIAKRYRLVVSASDCRSWGRKFKSHLDHITLAEIDRIIISTVILPLQLILEGSYRLMVKVCAQVLGNR